MKQVLVFLFSMLLLCNVHSQIIIPKKDYEAKVGTPRYSFGISLISGSHATLTSYAIVRENPDSTVQYIFMTFDSFIHQIAGSEKSLANPDKINFLEEYGIEIKDFENLWKLKFDTYPYGTNTTLGYGTELGAPSRGQYDMLKPYGISTIADYCFGDNLWKFMQKFKDPQWVGMYQNKK